MDAQKVLIVNGFAGGNLELEEVERSEVPAGYIRGRIVGIGECYVDPTQLQNGGIQHEPFPASVREVIERIARNLDGLQTQTPEQWEEGFRRDRHPWTEISLYERMVDGVERFAAHVQGDDAVAVQKRRDIFGVLLSLTNEGAVPKGWKPRAVGTVTASRVREMATWLSSAAVVATLQERARVHRNAILPNELPGPSRVSLEALFDDSMGPNLAAEFSPPELLNAADVILGVDVGSGREFLLYGRDAGPDAVRVLRIELDQHTDDLEKAVSLVDLVKGRHDYTGG